MKWFQGMPAELPARRAYVDWRGLIAPIAVLRYGEALLGAWKAVQGASFGWLEWDIAVDNDDIAAMERTAAKNPGCTITAPVRLYKPTTGGREAMCENSFGMVVFPGRTFAARQEQIALLRYPTADSDYVRQIQIPIVCHEARPKHLHWIGGRT